MSAGQCAVGGVIETPPRTEAELRQLIDRLKDPEEMARWLGEIWGVVVHPRTPPEEEKPAEQGRLDGL